MRNHQGLNRHKNDVLFPVRIPDSPDFQRVVNGYDLDCGRQPGVRELFSIELASAGYRVIGHGDFRTVTKVIDRSKPDLVLLDLYMERSDRWDVLIQMKRHYPLIPVIILTGF